jgi:hypothetical protein
MQNILLEGGNVFEDVTSFDHKHIPLMVKTLTNALNGTGINIIPVGSGASPTPGKQSGDLDVMADEANVLEFFNAKDPKIARKSLSDYLTKKGLQTKQTGINVHVRVPVGGAAHQVDIMVTPNAAQISKLHIHDIQPGSLYKGVDKHLLINLLSKAKGYFWSGWQGLYSRNEEGKKQDFISSDLNVIAKSLLDKNANASDLGSVEKILAYIKSHNLKNTFNDALTSFKAERTMTPDKVTQIDSLLRDSYIPAFKTFFAEAKKQTIQVGFFPGAFKPFHMGHLLTLQELAHQVSGPVFLLFSPGERKANEGGLSFTADKTSRLLHLYSDVVPSSVKVFKCSITPVKTVYDVMEILNTGIQKPNVDPETLSIVQAIPAASTYEVNLAVGDDPEDRKRYANAFKSQKYMGNKVYPKEVAPARFASATAFRNALENPLQPGSKEMIAKCIPFKSEDPKFKTALQILYGDSTKLKDAFQVFDLSSFGIN